MVIHIGLQCEFEDDDGDECQEELFFFMGESMDAITFAYLVSQGWKVANSHEDETYCPFHRVVVGEPQLPFLPEAL